MRYPISKILHCRYKSIAIVSLGMIILLAKSVRIESDLPITVYWDTPHFLIASNQLEMNEAALAADEPGSRQMGLDAHNPILLLSIQDASSLIHCLSGKTSASNSTMMSPVAKEKISFHAEAAPPLSS
jgi:hypothetical protein